MKLTVLNLLKMYGLNTSKIKLARHANYEIQILDTYLNNRNKFEAYQSFQSANKFSDAKHIAVFAPHRNTLALFLGIWDITNHIQKKEITEHHHSIIDKYNFPENWHTDIASYYELKYNSMASELSQRVIIDWGKGVLAWVQSKDKTIIEIRGKNSLGELPVFNQIILSHSDLKLLIQNPDTNLDWLNTLSSVKGIYLIRDKKSGKLYVGSASGGNGLFGRWKEYGLSGDGGNMGLKSLDPENFEYSILEILSDSITKSEIIHKENLWKQKLGTWETGLNRYEKYQNKNVE